MMKQKSINRNKFGLCTVFYGFPNLQGKLMVGKIGEWRFDKRSYGDKPPPRKLTLPPQGVPESVVRMASIVPFFFLHTPDH